jgi:hypothetical protein
MEYFVDGTVCFSYSDRSFVTGVLDGWCVCNVSKGESTQQVLATRISK